jgi:GH15 family glucan-1,4-alpha-glucosidase
MMCTPSIATTAQASWRPPRTPDGLEGEEGAFSICTFWLAEVLHRIGDPAQADRIFRRMLQYANHVGLYAEEIDPVTGDFHGNFPQGFTHLALIHCAVALPDRPI